ncbi:MAG: cysteine hydrolase [Deltaproteobacteria bacterium]|nr:cysteine hydrolase [Deltaproteobacteria bacterium]
MEDNEELIINTDRTALLLLHWQNELAHPDGKLSNHIFNNIKEAGTINNTQRVLKASRSSNMFIVYVSVAHRPGYPEMPPNPSPMSEGLKKSSAFLMGTWGAEIIDELRPLEDEIIVVNASMSGFIYSDLELLLRNRGINTIVLTGLATNWVIESTARDAFNRGYSVITLSDCCNSPSKEAHNYCLTKTLPVLGSVIDSNSFIKALEKNR